MMWCFWYGHDWSYVYAISASTVAPRYRHQCYCCGKVEVIR